MRLTPAHKSAPNCALRPAHFCKGQYRTWQNLTISKVTIRLIGISILKRITLVRKVLTMPSRPPGFSANLLRQNGSGEMANRSSEGRVSFPRRNSLHGHSDCAGMQVCECASQIASGFRSECRCNSTSVRAWYAA